MNNLREGIGVLANELGQDLATECRRLSDVNPVAVVMAGINSAVGSVTERVTSPVETIGGGIDNLVDHAHLVSETFRNHRQN